MLVHICCSVDSHYFLREMQKTYPHEKLIGFFYNPNIHPKEEHDLRLNDVRRSCKILNIELLEGNYNLNTWLQNTKGYEDEPEKGERCSICFDTRLMQTALKAKELSISKFSTTLLSSPMKEQQTLYMQGDEIAKQHNLEFIKINVRANGGVNKQNELAKTDNLYRQNYCGCQYALHKQRNKQEKVALEMLSSMTKQIMPGSTEERYVQFQKRDELEKIDRGYILTQRKNLVWRLLHAKVTQKREIIPSYIIARSMPKKNAKSGNIIWIRVKITDFYTSFQYILKNLNWQERMRFLYQKECEYKNNMQLQIGYSKKDDSIFLDIRMFNFFFNTQHKSIAELNANPPSYEQELGLRYMLCGMESVNPIIILDSQIPHDLIVDIESIMQDEKIYIVEEEFYSDRDVFPEDKIDRIS
ncbi:hypothetical protein CQA53_02930 [Helicobacter didelphidarum]|uniref:Epoxyqueuosine reductase QueH n=1 Tax=Helicobacter didelphidarum TaxID=2040648 RepID=A0A3D8INB0_9HELI|nr:epoxyqueuosine reductase QueH [Helicobacter didelphidarum]RDU66739.1 hypothetical protein CQA53_02930 [Helicobacter didelphidarum]